MNILVTGAHGQLGQSIKKIEEELSGGRYIYTDQQDLDITQLKEVEDFLRQSEVTHLINCAAYTAVDKAEEQNELAFLVNKTGPEVLAKACLSSGCRLIHISTDYVFSGTGHRPYPVSTPTLPQSVYAKSKADGEKAVLESGALAWVIRTSWLYSEFGNNFVKTMIRLGKERDVLRVVSDQVGSPTYAEDLARAILKLIQNKSQVRQPENAIYHFANSGVSSWFDFSTAIMEMAGLDCQIEPIPTEAYPLPAVRPFYSVLDCSLIAEDLNMKIPYWRNSLQKCIHILQKTKSNG